MSTPLPALRHPVPLTFTVVYGYKLTPLQIKKMFYPELPEDFAGEPDSEQDFTDPCYFTHNWKSESKLMKIEGMEEYATDGDVVEDLEDLEESTEVAGSKDISVPSLVVGVPLMRGCYKGSSFSYTVAFTIPPVTNEAKELLQIFQNFNKAFSKMEPALIAVNNKLGR